MLGTLQSRELQVGKLVDARSQIERLRRANETRKREAEESKREKYRQATQKVLIVRIFHQNKKYKEGEKIIQSRHNIRRYFSTANRKNDSLGVKRVKVRRSVKHFFA